MIIVFCVYNILCFINGIYGIRVQRHFEKKMYFIVDAVISIDIVHTHPPWFMCFVELHSFCRV
jgi:hypothetical protein